mmetsp:Transcript_15111/g.63756  ORF Transcript_15111/g.63756 Transcript_15111/m.63756 type:complete len:326 (-) Transcript_15111:1001-1978(-)
MYFPGIPHSARSARTSSLSTFPWMLISTPVSLLPGSLAVDVAAENDFCAALANASGSTAKSSSPLTEVTCLRPPRRSTRTLIGRSARFSTTVLVSEPRVTETTTCFVSFLSRRGTTRRKARREPGPSASFFPKSSFPSRASSVTEAETTLTSFSASAAEVSSSSVTNRSWSSQYSRRASTHSRSSYSRSLFPTARAPNRGRYAVDARYAFVATTEAPEPEAFFFSSKVVPARSSPLVVAESVAPASLRSADADVPAPASRAARTNSRYKGWSRSTRATHSCPCTFFTATSFFFSNAAKSFCCFLNALFFRSSVTSGGRDGSSRLA